MEVFPIEEKMIAPCGMNCTLCISHQAMVNDLNAQGFHKKYCPGCIPRGKNCTFMAKTCDVITQGKARFCLECASYPCDRLKRLDQRYQIKYHLSMIDNLNEIRKNGMPAFLANQNEKWKCPKCGGVISCHTGLCLKCDIEKLRTKKTYCWDEPVVPAAIIKK